MNEFKHPIIGQEAVCSDGLGRIRDFCDKFPEQWIQVDTYINNMSKKYDPKNVRLVGIECEI